MILDFIDIASTHMIISNDFKVNCVIGLEISVLTVNRAHNIPRQPINRPNTGKVILKYRKIMAASVFTMKASAISF